MCNAVVGPVRTTRKNNNRPCIVRIVRSFTIVSVCTQSRPYPIVAIIPRRRSVRGNTLLFTRLSAGVGIILHRDYACVRIIYDARKGVVVVITIILRQCRSVSRGRGSVGRSNALPERRPFVVMLTETHGPCGVNTTKM